jgi:hypothetical protein
MKNNKPLILVGNKRVVSSARGMAMIAVESRADSLEKKAGKLRLIAETTDDMAKRHKYLGLALTMLGQSQGLRIAHLIIADGIKHDNKARRKFRWN